MENFHEYANEERIIGLLAKERAKVALKNKLKGRNPQTIVSKYCSGEYLNSSEQIFLLMPPRDSWIRPCRRERVVMGTGEKRTGKSILIRSILLTIRKNRKEHPELPYLQRLDGFVAGIRSEILSEGMLEFTSMKIMGKTKKKEDGWTILRPICVFGDLKEKLLISLANSYLSQVFDPYLHEEILSYRPLRHYHGSLNKILTSRENAMDGIMEYRTRMAGRKIYVAECDIQKYFDTINHDIIRKHFRAMADRIPGFNYSQVSRIIDAYLDSYSFAGNVLSLNAEYARNRQRFDGPGEEKFVDGHCYTSEDFNASRDKIGIPQGGALSGLVSNVILNAVDRESILARPDSCRYFCRYGDDILLMHTDKVECTRLINSYAGKLTENKLLYHKFVKVSCEGETPLKHNDGRTFKALWSEKSKYPFLWGRGEDESADWIGFLGYELRYTGEIRVRRSSFDDRMKKVKRNYRSIAKTKMAKGNDSKVTAANLPELIAEKLGRFSSEGFTNCCHLFANRYSFEQARKLDAYTTRLKRGLVHKIIRNNLSDLHSQEHVYASVSELVKNAGDYRKSLQI